MGRVYTRKTERGKSYTDDEMNLAIDDVKNGRKTLRGAAKAYNIPRSTLLHRVQGTRGKGCCSKNGSGGGGKRQLAPEHEAELVKSLKTMEKWGFALTRKEILEIVQVFIQKNNIVTNFKNDKPGEEWFLGFKKRNKFSIKKPQHVECARMKSRNPFTFYEFYELLSTTIQDLNLTDKPDHIFNCDETSFCNDPKKTKVVGSVGNRTIRMTAGTGRENTSILICGSASGDLLPPLCIFKGQNILESWMSTEPSDQTAYAASKKGWMNTIIFSNWFRKCFLPFVGDKLPALLIYDGHSSHVNPEIIKEALENSVTILKLPPHTTDILQPLDVAVNKSLKDRWDDKLVKWQRANPRKRIPKQVFVGILKQVLDETPKSVVINGFKKTGIFDKDVLQKKGVPVNENVINEKIFNAEDLKRYKKYKEEQTKLPVEIGADVAKIVADDRDVDITAAEDVEIENAVAETAGENTATQNKAVENIIPDNANVEITEAENPPNNNSFEGILLKFIGQSKAPVVANKSRKRVCPSAEIITTPEFLKKFEAEEAEKRQKLEKKLAKTPKKKASSKTAAETSTTSSSSASGTNQKTKKKRRSPTPSSSTSEDNISPVSFQSDSSHTDEETEDTTVSVMEGDYVIVSYEKGYYPGQIIDRNDENTENVKISCMQRSGKLGDIWKWPIPKDELWYKESAVFKIINPPSKINNRGYFEVPEMKKFNFYYK